MAEVKIDSVIDKHDYDMKRALEAALSEVLPDVDIDRNELYRAFKRAVDRKLSTWVTVNDQDVRVRCRHCRQNT